MTTASRVSRAPWDQHPPSWPLIHAKRTFRSPSFEAVCSTGKLTAAFEFILYRGRKARGYDGESPRAFKARAEARIPQVETELRERRYHPEPALHMRLIRSDGSCLDTHVPTVEDAIVERVVYDEISQAVDAQLSDNQFAYRRHRSLQLAHHVVALHASRYRFALVTDVRGSFPSVPIGALCKAFAKLLLDRDLRRYVQRFVTAGIVRRTLTASRTLESYEPNVGLVAGRVLSPMAANVHLAPFAKALRDRAPSIVSSDDFAVFADSRKTLEAHHAWMTEALPSGLLLNETKTHVVDLKRGEKMHYLGMVFGAGGVEYSSELAAEAARQIQGRARGKKRRGTIASYLGRVHMGNMRDFWSNVGALLPEGTRAALMARLIEHAERRKLRRVELRRLAREYIEKEARETGSDP